MVMMLTNSAHFRNAPHTLRPAKRRRCPARGISLAPLTVTFRSCLLSQSIIFLTLLLHLVLLSFGNGKFQYRTLHRSCQLPATRCVGQQGLR